MLTVDGPVEKVIGTTHKLLPRRPHILKWLLPILVMAWVVQFAPIERSNALVRSDTTVSTPSSPVLSWSNPVAISPSGSGQVSDVANVSCATPSFCLAALGSYGIITYNGTSWSAPVQFNGSDIIWGVSCASISFCVAVDQSGYLFEYNGQGWSSSIDVGIGSPNFLSCLSSSFCMTAGSNGWSQYNGSNWSASQSLGSTIVSISCTSSTFCLAYDIDGWSEFNGFGWFPVAALNINGMNQTWFTCVSASFCIATWSTFYCSPLGWTCSVNYTYSSTFNGLFWGPENLIGSSFFAMNPVCFSPTLCFAQDGDGIEVFNGTWLSTPERFGPDDGFGITSMSCLSISFCMVVGVDTLDSLDPTSYAFHLQFNNGPSITSITPDIDSGVGPWSITITGTNFTGATEVYFGITPATSFTVNSSTSITASGTSEYESLSKSAVSVVTPQGTSEINDASVVTFGPGPGPGYYLLGADGEVYGMGSAVIYGDGVNLGSATAIAVQPGGTGYWITNAIGFVDAIGTAQSYYPSANPTSFVISIVSTPDGNGYWLTTSGGQVITAGDAQNFGSPSQSNLKLGAPIVNMTITPDGKGYWLLGADGGVFSYGDANFYGSTGNIKLRKPAIAMASTGDGKGYWFVASDGGIFAFGDANFYGSMGGVALAAPVVGMVSTTDGLGYWLVGNDGGVFAFGDAGYVGSLPSNGIVPSAPIDGFAAN